jgi:hypothetical protein
VPLRVIVRIDVVELKGRLAEDLYNGFSASHGVVAHVGVEKGKAPGYERAHLVAVKFIPHPDFEPPGDDSDVFPLRVPMGRDALAIGHLQANLNSPLEAVGSPSSAANCAPAGTTGGAGPQGMVSEVNAFFS